MLDHTSEEYPPSPLPHDVLLSFLYISLRSHMKVALLDV
jgi:hypothetical protein